jgi:hypothetical protein
VRFGDLGGLTSLPIPRLRDQFRHEEVLTVLPVRDALTTRETLFVATRPMLAVLTAVNGPGGQWMTRWAPWDAVDLSNAPLQDQEDDVHQLTVLVGGQAFHARLRGESGRRALRDFVAAMRTLRPTRAAGR